MRQSIRKKLGYAVLIILFICAGYLLTERFAGQVLLQWQHVTGIAMLAITAALFFINHKLGVLSTGLTVLLGLFGALSFSPAISTITIFKPVGDKNIPFLFFQPVFVLWTTLHFILSGRYYTGVATKKYWRNIQSDELFKIE